MTNLKWNDYSAAWNLIPEGNKIALAQKGFTHLFGNEVAAKVTALKKDGNVSEREATRAAEEWRDKFLDRVLNGDLTVSMRESDPVVVELKRIASGMVNKARPKDVKVVDWAKSDEAKAIFDAAMASPAKRKTAEAIVALRDATELEDEVELEGEE